MLSGDVFCPVTKKMNTKERVRYVTTLSLVEILKHSEKPSQLKTRLNLEIVQTGEEDSQILLSETRDCLIFHVWP
jgi:hypothetical protein